MSLNIDLFQDCQIYTLPSQNFFFMTRKCFVSINVIFWCIKVIGKFQDSETNLGTLRNRCLQSWAREGRSVECNKKLKKSRTKRCDMWLDLKIQYRSDARSHQCVKMIFGP